MGAGRRPPRGMKTSGNPVVSHVGPLPLIVVAFRLVARPAITFLELADKLVLFSANRLPIVVGQLAPLLAHFSFHLFPIAFESVPVHFFTSNLPCASASPMGDVEQIRHTVAPTLLLSSTG